MRLTFIFMYMVNKFKTFYIERFSPGMALNFLHRDRSWKKYNLKGLSVLEHLAKSVIHPEISPINFAWKR